MLQRQPCAGTLSKAPLWGIETLYMSLMIIVPRIGRKCFLHVRGPPAVATANMIAI